MLPEQHSGAVAADVGGDRHRDERQDLLDSLVVGWALVVYLLDGDWWVGIALGLIAVVMATLGDLCESVIKRDLGIKDMSQVIPGHGGLMDRLDSLLATVAPIWLLLHYAVF